MDFDWKIRGGHYQASEENSPSPDYPSEIETVNGSVEIDVVNKNLYNGKTEIGGINNDGTLNNTTDRWRTIDYINVKNITNISINIYNITTTGALGRYCFYDKNYNFLSSTQIINKNTIVNVSNVSYLKFWLLNYRVPSNAQIQVEADSTTDYVQHQSQTAIMPIQQEMLEGDYIKDVEHHTWKKIILTGNDPFYIDDIYHGIVQFTAQLPVSGLSIRDDTVRILSNYFKGVGYNNSWTIDNSVTILDLKDFRIMTSQYATVEDFKAWLKSKYDEGNPVIVYYKLATPINLELTEEQKAVRQQKLYTYKNITNISLSDELASIDVTYKKDLETEHNKLQNEIDEIKQLLSTTETSALLLDNLQKDAEMEVE